MTTREDFLKKILEERTRQSDLPGSELDMDNGVNDWIAIASHYLSEPARRSASKHFMSGMQISQEEFEDSLVKAGAVILAALEHSNSIKHKNQLR